MIDSEFAPLRMAGTWIFLNERCYLRFLLPRLPIKKMRVEIYQLSDNTSVLWNMIFFVPDYNWVGVVCRLSSVDCPKFQHGIISKRFELEG